MSDLLRDVVLSLRRSRAAPAFTAFSIITLPVGVLSYSVAGRRREIGVRRALGAASTLVRRMIVLDGLRPILNGLLAGLALGGALRFVAGRLVRGLPPVDLWLAAAVPLLFIVAGLIACYLLARRASEVEPGVALREP